MASNVNCQLPPCITPKRQQDGDGADMSDQQIQKSGAADLGDAMLRGHQEVGRQRHRLPRHHESIGIVREQYEAHAGEEQVVLQAQQSGSGSFAARK